MSSILERKQKRKSAKLKRLIRLFIFIMLLFILGKVVFSLLPKNDPPPETNIAQTIIPTKVQISITSEPPANGPLNDSVQNALLGTHGKYGVYVKHLRTGEMYSLRGQDTFDSGSLYKLWVMAEVFKKIESRELKENQTLSEKIETLNKKFYISDEYAEKKDGTLTQTVSEALYQMITISDNYSALLLTEKIGLSNVALFLQKNGFVHSRVGTSGGLPQSTPSDVSLFFEKLYKGELTNKTYTDKMLSLLKSQKLNDKIPKYLPDDIFIAHKTGELDEVTHDAGIVYTPNGDYIIVVLSQSDDPDRAKERIANVSEAVFTYFSEK